MALRFPGPQNQNLKRFRQVMTLHTRIWVILQRHLQLVPLFFIERTRLEAGGIHQRVLAAFASGLPQRRVRQCAADGVAFPIGGGVNVALTDSIHVYGEGYVAPEGLNNSVKNYVEANGGVSWTPVTPLTLKVGYRHVSVDGKDGRPGHTLIDGAYVGGGVSF